MTITSNTTSSNKPKCIACDDTGVSSKGTPCRPCVIRAEQLAQSINRSLAYPLAYSRPKVDDAWLFSK